MNLTEVVCEGVNWIHLAQDRVQQSALVNIVQVLVQTLGHIPKNAACTNVEQNFFFLVKIN